MAERMEGEKRYLQVSCPICLADRDVECVADGMRGRSGYPVGVGEPHRSRLAWLEMTEREGIAVTARGQVF